MNTTAPAKLAERWADTASAAAAPESPDWLRALHSEALAAFSDSGLPHRKVEAWKYTPLKRLEAAAPDLPHDMHARGGVIPPEALLSGAALTLDIVDGVAPAALPAAPEGVSLLTFNEALERFEQRLRGLAGKIGLQGPAQAFAAVNTAYLHHGLVMHVAAGVDAGIVLTRWMSGAESSERFSPFRLFVLLDEGARLELVEQHMSGDGTAGARNLVLQSQLGKSSELLHVRVQAEPEEALLLTTTSVEQAAESRYRYRGFDLGGGLVRHELNVELAGPGASADLAGACVLDGSRHGDTRISVDHAAPDCRSKQLFRSVLAGRSRGVFNGRALICEGADGSSVKQSNANLLLSPLAEMDTKPELEIYADEVEASHGATVGQLDETAIFYLRSRGLSEAEARRLLTAAFCHVVTALLDNGPLAETVGRMVDDAMPASE
ncbi:MAG: Fe-S cluster assembly protein SufD [Xanthomonadales bacterium]|jgi:Fe-S cluster assembly protein SufD|nr:Fe-S cluster assembly protein SufD [Xanthomonadales bacterium]